MNAIAKTANHSPTVSSKPILNDRLHALLASGETRIIGPKTADTLRAWIAAQPAPETPDLPAIETMITRLAMATKERPVPKKEAAERLDLYWIALRDIPLADLRKGFVTILTTATFMPTPAEVRKACLAHKAQREFLVSRARHLVWRHEHEWTPPVTSEPVTREEIERIKREAAARVAADRDQEPHCDT